MDSGTIELEEFKKGFLGKYFPHERREDNVEEFTNLKQGNISVEEYPLKFSMLATYAPSLVSNPRVEMITFVTGDADLVREKSRTAMLHDYMTLARLIVCVQQIEESKVGRISRNLKSGG